MKDYRDLFTVCASEDIQFRYLDEGTLTVGQLRRYLSKFPSWQPIWGTNEDGEKVPISYAELHEYKTVEDE